MSRRKSHRQGPTKAACRIFGPRAATARAVSEQQQQQASLRADIGNLQRSLDERKAALTKVQAESEILQAEIRNLTPVRGRLHQDIGQREQLDHDLKALNEAIGQKREELSQLKKEVMEQSAAREDAR